MTTDRWMRLDRRWNFRLLRATSACSSLALFAGLAWWLSSLEARAWLWPTIVVPGSLAALVLGLLLLLVTGQDWAAGEAWHTVSRRVNHRSTRIEQRVGRWDESPAFFLLVLAAKAFCGLGAAALGGVFLAGVLRSARWLG